MAVAYPDESKESGILCLRRSGKRDVGLHSCCEKEEGTAMTNPDAISKRKLINFMRQVHVDTSGMPDNQYLYATARNILADLVLVGIISGEFDLEPTNEVIECK